MKKSLIIILAVLMLGTITSCDVSGSDSNTEGKPTTPVVPPTPLETYTITFHSNNGLDETETQTVTENTPFVLKNNLFTNTGHGFTGWSTVLNSGVIDFTNQAAVTSITGDIVLYANWELGDTQDPYVSNIVMETGDLNITYADQIARFKVWVNDDIELKSLTMTISSYDSILGHKSKSMSHAIIDPEYTGTITGGCFTVEFTIPMGAEERVWRLDQVLVFDKLDKAYQFFAMHNAEWNYNFKTVGTFDRENPIMTDMQMLSNATLDTTNGDQIAIFKFSVEDDIKIKYIKYSIIAPVGDSPYFPAVSITSPTYSGNEKKGVFTIEIPFDQCSANGDWKINYIEVIDHLNKTSRYTAPDFISNGWANTVTKTGPQDLENPTISGVTIIGANSIDSSGGDQTVTINVSVTDDYNIKNLTYAILDPTGYHHYQTISRSNAANYTGGDQSGTFKIEFPVSKYAPNGNWTFKFFTLHDIANKSTSYNNQGLINNGWDSYFTKTGEQDISDPEILDFTMTTGNLNLTTGEADVTFKLTVRDDFYIDRAEIRIVTPGGWDLTLYPARPADYIGTDTSGYFTATATLHQSSMTGEYKVGTVILRDKSNKSHYLSEQTLISKNWNYKFNITN